MSDNYLDIVDQGGRYLGFNDFIKALKEDKITIRVAKVEYVVSRWIKLEVRQEFCSTEHDLERQHHLEDQS